MASRRSLQLVLNKIKSSGSRPSVRCFATATEGIASPPASSSDLIHLEHDYSAHNYHPVPIVFSHGKGSAIWDPEGKKYLDFLSAYSAVNQGHCHPKIMKALVEQAQTLTLSSRAFYNDKFPVFAEYLTKLFGYDMVLPMNTEKGEHIAGFLFEPIQGEAGVIIPPDGYLKSVRELCSKYNILMIADEIQSGLARSGRMLACDWEGVRPDIIILGKALGGGVIPVSAVLADKDVMLCIRPGEHGSTFGGSPLGSAVAIASLQVIQEEKLAERSDEMGEELRRLLRRTQQQFPDIVMEVRGKGLFNAVELISKALFPATAYDLCIKLKERGILAKPTHSATIRLTPPLSMSLEELREGAKAFHDVLEHDLPKLVKEKPKTGEPKEQNQCDRCGRNLYG
ncbi:Aminotransferase class-III [Cynara cardunculus var. scolymus]|uniref:Ornithine aminotransferase n=1 Tax=Cynara cardunculus var. scolymus TaxID=59895 RepID=A0A103XV24_CYNCS|nr:Aminotransferase class-III [Cynara cardunculus var. scolymus]